MRYIALFIWSALALWPVSVTAQTLISTPVPGDIPDPVHVVEHDNNIVTFLLLGSDTSNPVNAGRTDVILIVAVNPNQNAVSFLSIPRDLYVYIPGWTMQRINTAYGHGEQTEPGKGADLLIETIRYNLGLQIDYYARVDFNGFKQIVNAVGGVEIAVDCAIEDWQLKEPDLDPTIEENWEIVTLPIGVHHLDGDLALWYVRSRRTSSDFDRGRRQQTVIRALWRNVRSLGLLEQVTDLWPQMLELVETDVPPDTLVTLLPVATTLTPNRISSYPFRLNHEVINWRSPEGSSVLLPVPEKVAILMNDFMNPPVINQSQLLSRSVRIVNASGNPDLSRVAAERLAWEGFVVFYQDELLSSRQYTAIHDYTGQTKGSSLDILKTVFHVSNEGVVVQPDPNREYDYEIIIGRSYYPCTYNVLLPDAS